MDRSSQGPNRAGKNEVSEKVAEDENMVAELVARKDKIRVKKEADDVSRSCLAEEFWTSSWSPKKKIMTQSTPTRINFRTPNCKTLS